MRSDERHDDVLKSLQEYFPHELSGESIALFRKLVNRLRAAGANVVSVSLPATRFALSAYYVIASAEASSNLARYSGVHYGACCCGDNFRGLTLFAGYRADVPEGGSKRTVSDVYAQTRSRGFGREVRKRILLGTCALSAEWVQVLSKIVQHSHTNSQRLR